MSPDSVFSGRRGSAARLIAAGAGVLALGTFLFLSGGGPVLFGAFLPLLLVLHYEEAFLQPASEWSWAWFSFLLTAVLAFVLFRRLPAAAPILLAQLALEAAALVLSDRFLKNAEAETERARGRIAQAESSLKSCLQENQFYGTHIAYLKTQIGSRQKLSSFTREMGTLLDPETIKQKLLEKIQSLFPGEPVSLQTALPPAADKIDRRVEDENKSLLIKDSRAEPHSAIATPLLIEKKFAGLVRVDSASPNRFLETDLQQLELHAHIATLALENAQLFARVNAMAAQDALTGLATHRVFQERLADEILRAARYRKTLALLMLDVDHFKNVNDRYGHLAGDQVLKDVGRILKSYCREVDFAARYGGEEFTMLLPEVDPAQASQFAENLRYHIESHAVQAGPQTLKITVSIGCAVFPSDAPIASQLIRKADERLYRAKAEGRNRVVSQ